MQRRVAPSELPRVVPECCGLVWNALRAQQLKGGRNIAIYWDSRIRLEAGVEFNAPFTEADDLVRSATPSGPTAHAIHFGPYADPNKSPSQIRTDVFYQVATR